ncbi:MAG: hypothetical protein V4692_00035 [Bdellovibrionota bacterium]
MAIKRVIVGHGPELLDLVAQSAQAPVKKTETIHPVIITIAKPTINFRTNTAAPHRIKQCAFLKAN